MRLIHSPNHWMAVAFVAGVALLTWSSAHGQRADAGAAFQGRPAMAGAQAGTGAMAGPPQGGIAVQGQDNAGVALRRPSGLDQMPRGTIDPAADAVAVNRSVRNNRDIIPADRTSVAKDQRSATRKTKRSARKLRDQARHGVAPIGE